MDADSANLSSQGWIAGVANSKASGAVTEGVGCEEGRSDIRKFGLGWLV
jgi:hypothetical protein